MPIALCTFTAVAGKVWSGVAVATISASMSAPVSPASASAARAAAIARSEVSLALGGEVPALDAGAGADPLVGGVEGGGELGVLDHARRQVVAAADAAPRAARVMSAPPRAASGACSAGPSADPRGEPLGEAVLGEGEGELDRRRDAGGVGGAVRLDHRAVQPEEHAAVGPARVDALLQPLRAR